MIHHHPSDAFQSLEHPQPRNGTNAPVEERDEVLRQLPRSFELLTRLSNGALSHRHERGGRIREKECRPL